MTIIILLQIALLSIGTMFQWAYQLRDELATFVKEKGMTVQERTDRTGLQTI